MIDWNDLRYLLELARTRSFAAAAKNLDVNATTVARRIASLELMLEAKLLLKSPGQLELTVAGKEAVLQAEQMERVAEQVRLGALAQSAAVRGQVTLTVSDALGTRFIAPRLQPLFSSHPQLLLEMSVDSRLLDIRRGEADLAVRPKRPRQEGLAARSLGRIATGLYASASYIEALGVPAEGSELKGHRAIVRGDRGRALPEAIWFSSLSTGAQPVFTSYSIAAQVGAAVASLGIAALPCYWADTIPELRRIWRETVFFQDLWLVMRADARRVPRVRVAADFCVELFSKHSSLLLGKLVRPL